MIDSQLNLELMHFVETNILPKYASFGPSHGIAHAQHVIASSLKLARSTGADVNMAYVVAAYHDLGLSGPRAIHHITSGKILEADLRLKKWFSDAQIKMMKEAVEDHRASASRAPRSIYGKIVAEADREIDPDTVFRRTVQYGLEHYPEKNKQEHWARFVEHINNKYAATGYIKLWISNSPNEEKLKKLRSIIQDEAQLRKIFDVIYDEEVTRSASPAQT